MYFQHWWLTLFNLGFLVEAKFNLNFHDDSDLTKFVTRPEIKAPLFNISIYDRQKVSKGFWFVAPYAFVRQEAPARKYYQACQTGPLIYDGDGELVWSGACLVQNQNTCDFRAWELNGTFYLSGMLMNGPKEWQGHGFVMDMSYNFIHNVPAPPPIQHFNMHEFNLVDYGQTALHVINKPIITDISELDADYDSGWILDMGFREVDIASGKTKFMWWASEQHHVNVSESKVKRAHLLGPPPSSWDWFHGNAVDKDDRGDYLFNGRHTDTIYKISGQTGDVLWRLGGDNSSFIHDARFKFSRQHDARFLGRSGSKELISLLDNSADLSSQLSNHSSALVVELDHSGDPPRARVVQRIPRPDGKLTRSRGNHQRLPNGNAFVGWSDNGYISEHDSEGRILMDARFQSERFTTYRAYKFNFTGSPTEPPTVKAFSYGTTAEKATTAIFISWNGATDVETWQFFGERNGKHQNLGSKRKKGFETRFVSDGVFDAVYAKAFTQNGSLLGVSPSETVEKSDELTSPTSETSDVSRNAGDSGMEEGILNHHRNILLSRDSAPLLAILPATLLMIIAYRLGRKWLYRKSPWTLYRKPGIGLDGSSGTYA